MPDARKLPASDTPKSAGKRRPRRTREQIVEALLTAATEEFEENGYEKARTAAIAQRADVVEPLLFKYFNSKFNVFQNAIFKKLDDHFRTFVESHDHSGDDPDGRIRNAKDYIGEQQDFLEKSSRMFMSLIVNESYDTFVSEGMSEMDGLQMYLDKMASVGESFVHHPESIAPGLVARIAFGTLMAGVLFRKWLFPEGMASNEEIRAAIIEFIVGGASMRPLPMAQQGGEDSEPALKPQG